MPHFKGQIFGGSQRHTRCCDTLNRRVVGKVRENDGAVDGACAAEFLNEELRFLKRNTDGGEDDGKVGSVVAQNLCLTRDLRGKLCMGKTGAGEDRQLLAADKGVQTVDRGNAGLDKFVRVIARGGVHRQTVNVLQSRRPEPRGRRPSGGPCRRRRGQAYPRTRPTPADGLGSGSCCPSG